MHKQMSTLFRQIFKKIFLPNVYKNPTKPSGAKRWRHCRKKIPARLSGIFAFRHLLAGETYLYEAVAFKKQLKLL